ncbi:hypothetical protein TNCV_337241 [Trichonephila clavipes]|nr:hypothetical protein TNCV_337241 [Trichonephila clavipes]
MEVQRWVTGPTPQTNEGGMRKFEYFLSAGSDALGSELLFLVLEVLCRFSCPTPQTDDGGMTEGRTRAFVLGVGGPVWFSCLTLQTDDGGMRKGIINDFYTFCYLEYFVRAGLVHGDGGAVLGHRPYSQMDDGGIRERRSCRSCRWWCCDDSPTLPTKELWRNEEGAGLVVHGDGCVVMILRTYSQTDAGRMREEYFVRAGAVELGDGGAVMNLQPCSTNG